MFQKIRIIVPAILLYAVAFTSVQAQTVQKKLQWSVLKKDNAPTFDGAYTDDRFAGLPYFSETVKATSYNSAKITNPVFENVNESLSEDQKAAIGPEIIFNSQISFQKKQPYLTLSLFPFRKNQATGTIQKLVSYSIIYERNYSISTRSAASRTYAANSVLASGNWYKIAVSKDGVYRMGYNELKNLGLDVANIDPRNIRVYGNGGGMLPERNSDFRHDDLFENPIKVIGENDGIFNEGDYILFYAKGPDQWTYNTAEKAFNHETNPYTTESYYFITADLGTGKRITSRASSSTPSNYTVTSFNDYALHELDQSTAVNTTIKSGRERYGEEFNNQLSYDFDFNFPNLIKQTKVKVKTVVIGRSMSVSSYFTVKFNGANFYNILCAPVPFNYDDPYGTDSRILDSALSPTDNIRITVGYNKPNSTAIGFLNYIELNGLRQLTMNGEQMPFRNVASAATGRISSFIVNNVNATTEIWDVTNKTSPVIQLADISGSTKNFVTATDSIREFIAFNGTLTPGLVGRIPNQNLHATGFPDMVIFSNPQFVAASERLAEHRRQNNGLDVVIITPDELYNEFSSGARDASAIRDFLKMLYDRAGTDESKMPRFLLMMGDGSYDNKGVVARNTDFLPTFESRESNIQYGSVRASYVSDDYFGMLDDVEGGWDMGSNAYGLHALDVAVGRLPVQKPEQAQQMVDKIIHYTNTETFGDWRNKYVLVADDEDNNAHLNDAEANYRDIIRKTQRINIDKIYLDSYPQVSVSAGKRYPSVNEAINQEMANGCLIINYSGHGSEMGLGHEQILTLDDINSWKNYDKMPLMVTATCSFSRWDDPAFQSAGEQSLLNANGGAIALFTTTRVVNSLGNRQMNEKFIQALFDTVVNNGITLGDVFVRSKNLDPNIGFSYNNRNFTLLGDPSLPFAMPRLNIMTDKLNGISVKDTAHVDTLKALTKVTITGYVTDKNGNKLSNYNGIVYPQVFDKKTMRKTLGQDPTSKVTDFALQNNVIYKGKSSVRNGEFEYTFVVPKDISYSAGYGRLSYYSNTGMTDANGNFDSIVVGGSSNSSIIDTKGPEIKIFLNDENFASGGLTGESPNLIVKLKDDNGINTVGNGIGHDLMATLIKDGQEKAIELNNYYEAKLDSYQEGEINYPMTKMAPGRYQLKVKAWDVFNNSNENITEFWVADSKDFTLDHVLNYPNPFTTLTDFQFEHNRPGDDLDVQVQIFTVSGKLVKTIHQSLYSSGSRVTNIKWDGKDDYGDKIGRGVYLYKLKVRSSNGSVADKYEKLVILN